MSPEDSCESKNHFEQLPDNVLTNVLRLLDPLRRKAVRMVSKTLRELVNAETTAIQVIEADPLYLVSLGQRFPHAREAHVRLPDTDDASFLRLLAAGRWWLPQIHRLHVADIHRLSPEVIKPLGTACPSLQLLSTCEGDTGSTEAHTQWALLNPLADAVAALPGLVSLDLAACNGLRPAALTALSMLTALRSLSVWWLDIAAAQQLAGLPMLSSLTVIGFFDQSSCLAPPVLPSVTTLELLQTTPQGLDFVTAQQQVRRLMLGGKRTPLRVSGPCIVTQTTMDLAALGVLGALRSLQLMGFTQVTNTSALAAMCELTSLQLLECWLPQQADLDGLGSVSSLIELTLHLEMSRDSMPAAVLDMLQLPPEQWGVTWPVCTLSLRPALSVLGPRLRLLAVRLLDLGQLSLDWVLGLPRMHGLVSLEAHCIWNTDMSWLGRLRPLSMLSCLTVNDVDDAALDQLAELRPLTALRVQRMRARLACPGGFQHLEQLTVRRVGDDDTLSAIADSCRRLLSLDLGLASGVTAAGLSRLTVLTTLTSLYLGQAATPLTRSPSDGCFCLRLCYSAVSHLVELLPSLSEFQVDGLGLTQEQSSLLSNQVVDHAMYGRRDAPAGHDPQLKAGAAIAKLQQHGNLATDQMARSA